MNDIGKSPTFRLFARPSFIEGVARVFDIGSNLQVYNYSKSDWAADTEALYSDWRSVGNQLRAAIHEYGRSAGSRP